MGQPAAGPTGGDQLAAARGERDPERLQAAAVHLPDKRALKAAN
jgi:hypothetical protein